MQAAVEKHSLELLWLVIGGRSTELLKPLRSLQDILHPLLHRDILSKVLKHFVSENLACDIAGPIESDLSNGDDLLFLDFATLAVELEPHSVEVRNELLRVLRAF